MGLIDIFKTPRTPTVTSILPEVAKKEIIAGRPPILRTTRIFLQDEEILHYMDNAIYEKENVNRRTYRRNAGYSMPGFFKGTRIYLGGGSSDSQNVVSFQQIRGMLYITNKRLIFVGDEDGFDENILTLTAVTPYSNCIQLQFGKSRYRLFVPDGNIPHILLQQLHQ